MHFRLRSGQFVLSPEHTFRVVENNTSESKFFQEIQGTKIGQTSRFTVSFFDKKTERKPLRLSVRQGHLKNTRDMEGSSPSPMLNLNPTARTVSNY